MISVKTYQSQQVTTYKEKKYQQFLQYYINTTIPTTDIYKIIQVNDTNSTARYIRNKLKKDGYDSLKRHWSIRRGEWLCTNQ